MCARAFAACADSVDQQRLNIKDRGRLSSRRRKAPRYGVSPRSFTGDNGGVLTHLEIWALHLQTRDQKRVPFVQPPQGTHPVQTRMVYTGLYWLIILCNQQYLFGIQTYELHKRNDEHDTENSSSMVEHVDDAFQNSFPCFQLFTR